MIFRYKTQLMCQALEIVANEGWEGLKFEFVLSKADGAGFQSNKSRIAAKSAHRFTAEELKNYMVLANRDGLITWSEFSESDHFGEHHTIDGGTIKLTLEGWRFWEKHSPTTIERWGGNIWENVPTVVFTVLLSWALYIFGAPN